MLKHGRVGIRRCWWWSMGSPINRGLSAAVLRMGWSHKGANKLSALCQKTPQTDMLTGHPRRWLGRTTAVRKSIMSRQRMACSGEQPLPFALLKFGFIGGRAVSEPAHLTFTLVRCLLCDRSTATQAARDQLCLLYLPWRLQ